jgi:hypothetical protein
MRTVGLSLIRFRTRGSHRHPILWSLHGELLVGAGGARASDSIPRCRFRIELVRSLSKCIPRKSCGQSCRCTERGPQNEVVSFSLGFSSCGTFVFQGFTNPSAISSHLDKSLEISSKTPVSRRAVLKTFQIGFKLQRRLGWKAINPPCSVASALDHSPLTQVGEMLRYLGLRQTKNLLEMADTKWTACQQMDDPQPRDIAKTLINLHQFHCHHICAYTNICQLAYFGRCDAWWLGEAAP